MYLSKLLVPTTREIPADAEVISHQLLIRAGYIRRVANGIYNYLPLMVRVFQNIEKIIREEMNAAGAQELLMPILQPSEVWEASGRWSLYGELMLRVKDRHDRLYGLAPTAEEVITSLAMKELRSYKQLPVNLYQIQTKYRDEIRPRFGLLRGREFIMKDAYSFHVSQGDLDREYNTMTEAYLRIFNRLYLPTRIVKSDSGDIGGSISHEFMVIPNTKDGKQDSGENTIQFCSECNYAINDELNSKKTEEVCPECKNVKLETARGIEVGNIFQLGTKYSTSMNSTFTGEDGKEQPFVMGCYGIGVSRVAAALIEFHHDEFGIIWPMSVTPYKVVVIPVNTTDKIQMALALEVYSSLKNRGIDVLLDDRDERAGVKFKDADLMGFPIRITVGKQANDGLVEIKLRNHTDVLSLEISDALFYVHRRIENWKPFFAQK